MKFSERNLLIKEVNNRFAAEHDKYTCSVRILNEEEWNDYVHAMDSISNEFRGGHMEKIVSDLCMAYLDDTEEIQKKLKGSKNAT